MLVREYGQLAVYEIKNSIETVPLRLVRELIEQKGSDIVYVLKDNKLYGIICLGEILRSDNEKVPINKKYCYVEEFDVVKAHRLFDSNPTIYKIPIIDNGGRLIADYDRWEDVSFLERNQAYYMQKELTGKYLRTYGNICVVEPVYTKKDICLELIGYLQRFHIRYSIKTKSQVMLNHIENEINIFLDQDELRAARCLGDVNLLPEKEYGKRCITYRDLLYKIMQVNDLGYIPKNECNKVNKKASVLLAELRKRGIRCICINGERFTGTEYANKIYTQIKERLKTSRASNKPPWTAGLVPSTFWCDLYQLEDYKNGVVQKELADSFCNYRRNDIVGKYCNTKDGKRVTLYQPQEYIGSIYFIGPCTFYGYYCEDQYTIESFLQQRLLEEGYFYRVENYASPVACMDGEIDNRLIEIGDFYTNDILVYMSRCGDVDGVKNYNLWDICEEQNVPSEWMIDGPFHINHKANKLVADSIFALLESSDLKKPGSSYKKSVQIDFRKIMEDYIYRKYLNRYFSKFPKDQYHSIGAIVMNCNPFTKGHRYLIGQACDRVDFLIIFVVEENKSLFSFEERYKMVKEGVRELKNVMVVPSGEFVLSYNNFWEYFAKGETGVTDLSAEYDINFFTEYIATPLHITHRFAGEEPLDKITKVYNEVMKRILSQRGIEFIEIPRVEVNGEIVSASRTRKYMECGEYEKAFHLLPETTISFLKGHKMTEKRVCNRKG